VLRKPRTGSSIESLPVNSVTMQRKRPSANVKTKMALKAIKGLKTLNKPGIDSSRVCPRY